MTVLAETGASDTDTMAILAVNPLLSALPADVRLRWGRTAQLIAWNPGQPLPAMVTGACIIVRGMVRVVPPSGPASDLGPGDLLPSWCWTRQQFACVAETPVVLAVLPPEYHSAN